MELDYIMLKLRENYICLLRLIRSAIMWVKPERVAGRDDERRIHTSKQGSTRNKARMGNSL